MKSRKVAEINGRNIILVDKEANGTSWIEWVVSRTYDESQPEEQKWNGGKYFDSLTNAINYATGKENSLYLLTLWLDKPLKSKVSFVLDSFESALREAECYLQDANINNFPDMSTCSERVYVNGGSFYVRKYYIGQEIF